MTAHLDPDQMLAVVALAEDEPERVAAYEHAASCAECRALLRAHEQLLSSIDDAFAPAPISPALAARIQARVFPQRWPKLVLVSSWIASLLLVLLPAHQVGALSSAIGMHCALSESAFAVAPLGIAAWMSRGGKLRPDPIKFAVTGGFAGVVGQLWLRNHCPAHGSTLHAFAFHFLIVIAISLVAGMIGQRLLSAQP